MTLGFWLGKDPGLGENMLSLVPVADPLVDPIH